MSRSEGWEGGRYERKKRSYMVGVQMELFISHTTATDNWIKDHHYLHSAPAGARVRMEFYIPYAEADQLAHGAGMPLMDSDRLDGKYMIT